jgi:hypothetical protein
MDTGMRPNEQMALRWFPDAEHPEKSSYVDFEHKKIGHLSKQGQSS